MFQSSSQAEREREKVVYLFILFWPSMGEKVPPTLRKAVILLSPPLQRLISLQSILMNISRK